VLKYQFITTTTAGEKAFLRYVGYRLRVIETDRTADRMTNIGAVRY